MIALNSKSILAAAILLSYGAIAGPSSTTTSSKLPQYTYTLIKTATNCPTPLPTHSLTEIPAARPSHFPHFYAFGNSDTGAIIPQVIAPDHNGNQITFKMDNTSRIEMYLPQSTRVIVDNDGARLFLHDCKHELHLPIPNVARVLNAYAKPPPSKLLRERTLHEPIPRQRVRRGGNLTMDATFAFVDQCNKPIVGHNAYIDCDLSNPSVNYYPLTTEYGMTGGANGIYTGSCPYPDVTSDGKVCRQNTLNIIDFPNNLLGGQLTNFGADLKILSQLITGGVIARAIAGAASTFDLPAVALSLGALSLYQGFIAAGGDTAVAGFICNAFEDLNMMVSSRLDVESEPEYITLLTSAPFPSITATQTVTLSSITSCPAPKCTSPGICGQYSSCGSASAGCFCGGTVEAKPICFPNVPCKDAVSCESSSECGNGNACLSGGCCNGNICVPVSVCKSSNHRHRIFSPIGQVDSAVSKGA